MLAASWMDKKEMMVVAFKGGRVQKVRYDVMQRKCHAFYREHFHSIDVLNKLAFGPGSITHGWKPQNGIHHVLKTICMYTLAMIKTNAYRCYFYFPGHEVSGAECKVMVVDALFAKGFKRMHPGEELLAAAEDGPRGSTKGSNITRMIFEKGRKTRNPSCKNNMA